MRLFELHLSGDGPRLSFHPRITVIRGLDEAATAELRSVLRALAAGETPQGPSGSVEVHGVVVPLEGMAQRVGPAVGEPVIAPIEEVLPPVPGPPADASEAQPIMTHARALATREALETAVSELAAQLAAANGEREGLGARLVSARRQLDRGAAMLLDVADSELRSAARDLGVDRYGTQPDLMARAAQLNDIIDECDKILPELPAGDRATLAGAAATLRAALSNGKVVSPEADALAEAWLSLHRRLDGIESRLETASRDTEALAARLEAARQVAAEARAASTPREVTVEEEQRLETLHNRVVELQTRATSGVRRGSARKHLEEVHAELGAELEALGYPTFMAYRMGNGLSTPDPDLTVEYDAAAAELAAAEVEWAELMERLQGDEELNDVLIAIEQVSGRAIDLLGVDLDELEGEPPEVLAERLRGVRIDAESLRLDPEDAADHLRSVLDGAGAGGHRDVVAPEAVLALGDSWLEVLRAADDAAVRVLRDRERAETELVGMAAFSDTEAPDVLAEARSRVTEVEADIAELRRGLVALAAIRHDQHDLTASVLRMAENHDAKMELLEAARAMEEAAAARLPANVKTETTRRGITALVPRGLGGPVPMIVELGDVDDISVEQLLGIPDDIQVIALGGGAGVVEWVEDIGPDYALLVDVGAPV
jgi:hypothetical protein